MSRLQFCNSLCHSHIIQRWTLLFFNFVDFCLSYYSRQLNYENSLYSLETPFSCGGWQQTTMVPLLTSYAPHTHCAPQTHVTYTHVCEYYSWIKSKGPTSDGNNASVWRPSFFSSFLFFSFRVSSHVTTDVAS